MKKHYLQNINYSINNKSLKQLSNSDSNHRRIQNPIKHPKRILLIKQIMVLSKNLHPRYETGLWKWQYIKNIKYCNFKTSKFPCGM